MRLIGGTDFRRLIPWLPLGLIALSVLWRGGKSLDATWGLVGVVGAIVVVIFLEQWGNGKLRIENGELRSRNIPMVLWLAVILLIAWTAISYVFSATSNYGLDAVLRTGALGLLFLWVIRFSRSADRREYQWWLLSFVRVVAMTTLAACAIGLLVYVLQPVNRFVGTFFDYRFHTDYWPNAWAEYLLLSWPLVFYWAMRTWRPKPWSAGSVFELLVRCGVLGIILGSFLLSYSRASFIAFGLQLILWVFIYARLLDRTLPWKRIATVAAIVALTGFAVFSIANALRGERYDVQSVVHKATFTATEGSSSVSERQQFWQQSFELSLEKPLLGWGPYSFRFVQPRLQKSVLATSDHPHNVILKLAMERGWIAAILFAFIASFILLKGFKAEVGRERVSMHHASFGILIVLGITGLLAHNLVDYNLQFVGISVLFWMLLGILASRIQFEDSKMEPTKFARVTECTIALALLLVALFEGIFLVTSSIGRHAEARGDVERALEWYDRSRYERFTRDLHLSRATLFFESGRYDEASQALNDYAARNTEDARYWKRKAEVAAARGSTDEALELYDQALRLGRSNDIGITTGIVRTLLNANRHLAIKERRQAFDVLLSQYVDAISRNVHFIALSPNVEGAIELAELLARVFPGDAPAYQVLAARADHHSKIERERIRSRPPGFLW